MGIPNRIFHKQRMLDDHLDQHHRLRRHRPIRHRRYRQTAPSEGAPLLLAGLRSGYALPPSRQQRRILILIVAPHPPPEPVKGLGFGASHPPGGCARNACLTEQGFASFHLLRQLLLESSSILPSLT